MRELTGRYGKIAEDKRPLFESKIPRVQVRYSRPDQLGRYRTIREVIGSYGKIQKVTASHEKISLNYRSILYSKKTSKAEVKLASVPNRYLFLKSFPFKSSDLAQVLIVIIIAIAAKLLK